MNWLRANGWPDARRYLAGDGRQPGDLDWHPLVACEVKDRADSAWPAWCRQAAQEARPGMVPMVVRRTRGVPDVGLWETRVEGAAWSAVAEGMWAWSPPMLLLSHSERTFVDDQLWIVSTFGAVAAAVASTDQEET